MGLPCLVNKCAATCTGPQADPWDPALMWPECPGKAAFKRNDVEGALTVRGMSTMAPLADWPHGYAAWVVETWSTIEAEKQALRETRNG